MVVALSIIPLTFIYIQKNTQIIVVTFGIIILLIGILVLPEKYPGLQQNIERITGISTEIREGTGGGRTVIWSYGITAFYENPIKGVGAGGFGRALEQTGYGRTHAAHNAFLSVLVDTGLIGITLFLLIFFVAGITALYSNHHLYKIFYLVLILTMFAGFIPANLEANKATWFVMAIGVSQYALLLKDRKFVLIEK